MIFYGDPYLYEIRQRAINVFQGFDDQYIGRNHVKWEKCREMNALKIRAINRKQFRTLAYFLYTFTPEKVINLIDDILKMEKDIEELNQKITATNKEADWLADILARDCAGLDDGSCAVCGMREGQKGIDCLSATKESWREAARKAVGEGQI